MSICRILIALLLTVSAAAQTQTMVPMSDGVELVTVVYLPAGAGPWPVVLERTPYPRAGSASRWTNQGMAYVEQSVRGHFGSQGEFRPFADEGWGENKDGRDTVNWILEQDWCNGKIGTYGGSAQGITSSLLAGATPDLQMQIMQDAAADFLDHLSYQGGVLRKSLVEGWLNAGVQVPQYADVWKAEAPSSDYWHTYDAVDRAPMITAPGLHVGGWWDIFARGTVNNFMARQYNGGEGARGNQKLVMRPTAHGPWFGNEALSFPANFDDFQVTPYRNRFAQYWLNGTDNGIMDEPPVNYYVVGDDGDFDGPGWEWRTADKWPPFPPNIETPLYLAADGTLNESLPESKGSSLSYAYDPADPVPTNGGQNLVMTYGPHDQAASTSREDVLLFTTAPLSEPLEATGPFRVVLHISSDAPDTDFTAKLVDVYPGGKHVLMLDNIQRVKYRNGDASPAAPLMDGEIVELEIDLGHISWIFNTGHRIGLHISSSNYPRFEINPNNGDELPGANPNQIANNTIHTSVDYPSALYIPQRQPNRDTDNDGLLDEQEWNLDTNIDVSDSDDDNLSDGDEVNVYGTNPNEADSDMDGHDDGVEITAGTDPNDDESFPIDRVGGDVDGDGNADAVDVQLVINRVLGQAVQYDCDLNCDNNEDASDIQLAINAALGLQVSAC